MGVKYFTRRFLCLFLNISYGYSNKLFNDTISLFFRALWLFSYIWKQHLSFLCRLLLKLSIIKHLYHKALCLFLWVFLAVNAKGICVFKLIQSFAGNTKALKKKNCPIPRVCVGNWTAQNVPLPLIHRRRQPSMKHPKSISLKSVDWKLWFPCTQTNF